MAANAVLVVNVASTGLLLVEAEFGVGLSAFDSAAGKQES
jgi:hypothetical protein